MLSQLDQTIQTRVNSILEIAQNDLRDLIGKPVVLNVRIKMSQISADVIILQVCEELKMRFSDIVSDSQKKELVVARHLIMWLCAYYCGFTDKKIGEILRRDRSTVTHSLKTVNDMLDTNDPIYLAPLQAVETRILKIKSDQE